MRNEDRENRITAGAFADETCLPRASNSRTSNYWFIILQC